MSTGSAIAAVTLALQNLISNNVQELSNPSSVTTLPPDLVRNTGGADQLNLFLYHMMPDAAWRNMDMPRQVLPGERGQPPLPLALDYLITAYGKNDHKLLGKTMSVLHDHPLLGADELKSALEEALLHLQVERVRLTLQPLSLEDMYRLWNGFQTQYRISAAYRIGVVLIESTRATYAALPVIRRGDKDEGPAATAGAAPLLTNLVLPDPQSSARLGDTIVLQGVGLTTQDVVVRFSNPTLSAPIDLTPEPGPSPGEIQVSVPDTPAAMAAWVPGLYSVALAVKRLDPPRFIPNEESLTLGLAPRITRKPLTVMAAGDTLTVTCAPRLNPSQSILLVIGGGKLSPTKITNDADTSKPTSLEFKLPTLASNKYVIRLRVGDVDSIPVVRQGSPPIPSFDPDQTVQM